MLKQNNRLSKAAEAGKKGDYNRAQKILGELISETDAPPEAWLLLGRSFHARKEHSKALAAFNDYISLRPDSHEGYLFAGRTYLALGIPQKAVSLLRRALAKCPSDEKGMALSAEIKALLGTAHLKAKNSGTAVGILQDAVESSPENKRIYRAYLNALLVRGVRLCATENNDLGLQMLRFVLHNGAETGLSKSKTADSPFLRLVMGKAARELGLLEEALEHFSAALELSKDDARIRWSRASVLMALGRDDEAKIDIAIIRSENREVPELPWNTEMVDFFMIKSFMEKGEWRQAAIFCRNWLLWEQGTPKSKPMIHALYAETLRNMKNFKAAHNHLKRALEKEPRELEFWYALIMVSWEARDYKSLEKALKAVSSLGGDADLVKRFTILCTVQSSKDIKKNISLLQEGVRYFGPEPELMISLANAYLKAGMLKEAGSWFKKTRLVNDGYEEAWLGEIAALEAGAENLKPVNMPEASDGKLNSSPQIKKLYREYLKKWPGNRKIHRDLALFLVKKGDYREAVLELEKLLVWEPVNPSLRKMLAFTYRKTGHFREAAMYLKALLKEDPKDIELLLEYTGCLERAGAVKFAEELLEKARDMLVHTPAKNGEEENQKKEIFNIVLAMGMMAFRENEKKKAFDRFKEAISIFPKDPRPHEWINKM